MTEIITPTKEPGDQFRNERHHARMTLLPIIAECGNSLHVVMCAVRALYRVEHMVADLIKEAQQRAISEGGQSEDRGKP